MPKWRKLGKIFVADHQHPWMATHGANPVAEALKGSLYKVYFCSRDAMNRSHVAYVVLDLKDPFRILEISSQPVIAPGPPGAFDESGAVPACIVPLEDKRFFYYLGWTLCRTVPWHNSIGLAVSHGGGGFEKYSRAPIMDRTDIDPFSLSYPWVLRENGIWRMWYGTNLGWGTQEKDMRHVIRYAESSDGIHWQSQPGISINLESEDEYAIARPCVVRDPGEYKMWYSHRGPSYRIGYATSPDGLHWTRRDGEAGIGVSDEGWDSQAVQYAFVFDHGGARYMLYNGNRYGATGFGLAIQE